MEADLAALMASFPSNPTPPTEASFAVSTGEPISPEISQQVLSSPTSNTTSPPEVTTNTSTGTSSNWVPDTLVLGPGGIKGFKELGSLLAFEREGFLDQITTIVGVSVGALIGLLLAAGLSISEIIDAALQVDFFDDVESAIHDLRAGQPYGFLSKLPTVRDRKGLLSNGTVKNELQRQLVSKFGFTPTLHQLYLATGIKFVATTMNLERRTAVYLSYETDPQLSVVDAVLLSMNIPLVFYQLRYRGDLYIDGAFANPYPVDLFSGTHNRVLGISILSSGSSGVPTGLPTSRPVVNGIDSNTRDPSHDKDDTMVSYLMAIIYSTLDTIRDRIIRQSHFPGGAYHLQLTDRSSLSIDVVGLGLGVEQKSELVADGYHQALDFIDQLRPNEIDRTGSRDETYCCDQGIETEDPGRPNSIVVESGDPIPLLSAFLASNPSLTGALLAMSTGSNVGLAGRESA